MPRFSADPLVSAPHRLFAAAACLALACLLTGAAKAPEQTAALESLVLMHVDGNITIEPDGADALRVVCTAVVTGRTGVEMEALTGATVAALTIYDMCKAFSHDISIEGVQLIEKTGGKKDFHRPENL